MIGTAAATVNPEDTGVPILSLPGKMPSMWRRIVLYVLTGFFCGMLIGILCPLLLVFLAMWYDGTPWPKFRPEMLLLLSLAGAEGALNGAIGTLDGLRSTTRRLWPIIALPSLLLMVPFLAFFYDQKTQVGGLFVGLAYGMFALIA